MCTSPKHVTLSGTGLYLPERIVTNDDLSAFVDTSDEWIRTRSGIRERRFAAETEATSDMAVKAAEKALESAGIAKADIELIIVATMTPDLLFPSTACLVQDKLGIPAVMAFDITAACSGFVYALDVGTRQVQSGAYRNALVIGAEKMSSILDFKDRSTCVLFGDGAGAVVLTASDTAGNGAGVLGTVAGVDGSKAELLYQPAGGARLPSSSNTIANRMHFLKMNGREIFKLAVRVMSQACWDVLDKCGYTVADVDIVIPHQANIRIIDSLANRMGIPIERFHNNLDRYGNTSAASIPIALDEARSEGRLKDGDLILIVGFGAGLTWGASLIQWSEHS